MKAEPDIERLRWLADYPYQGRTSDRPLLRAAVAALEDRERLRQAAQEVVVWIAPWEAEQHDEDGRTRNLGHFIDPAAAAQAYDAAAQAIFGEFAVLNFAESRV